jgi:hypothetical protein
MHQQIEHLRLQGDQLTVAAQLAKAGIKEVVAEAEFHVRCRISSQETIKCISCRDQAGGKVFAADLLDPANIKAAFPFPYGAISCPTPA